jgi:16S rRNA (guanine527-N7)-methyltransferase
VANPRGPRSTGNKLNSENSIESARNLLIDGLGELEIAASPKQTKALIALASLLARWSRRMNLTAHLTPDAITRGLLLESAALATRIPPVASLADIGSGAGFPGLPVAILWPEIRVTLVESRQKRHHFQRAAIRELGLSNATPKLGRSEDLEPRPHGAAIAQALAPPERALPWMLPWVEVGGFVLLPGSSTPPEIPERRDVSFEDRVRYRVPCGGPERTLWIGRYRGP